MHDRIFSLLVEENEVTWQSILFNLIKTEQMNPWDIDLSILTKKYIDTLKQLKKMDFRLSGKVLLCAAILLRVKSSRLVSEDIMELDRLIAPPEDVDEDEFYDELEKSQRPDMLNGEKPELIPRTPQPRKRKVSIYDLVSALEKALDVKRRRVLSSIPSMNMEIPQKGANVNLMIKQLYAKILTLFSLGKKRIMFSQLIPSENKYDKVRTFVPLLHLTNQRKVDLEQEIHFGEIAVFLRQQQKEAEKELETATPA